MPPCRSQLGQGFGDFGPPLKMKRVYQTGGRKTQQSRNYVYSQPDFFVPSRSMRGAGIGSLFVPLFRYLAPIVSPLISKGLNAIKNELVSTGRDILLNPTKEVIKKRSRAAFDNLAEKADKKIKLMTGKGVKRRRIKRSHRKISKHSGVNHQRGRKKKVLPNKKVKILRNIRRGKKVNFKNDIFS